MADRSHRTVLEGDANLPDQELCNKKQITRHTEEENRRLRSLLDLACLLNRSDSLGQSLQFIADHARGLLGSHVSCIALIDRPNGKLLIGGWSGEHEPNLRGQVFPIPETGLGVLAVGSAEGVVTSEHLGENGMDTIIERVCSKATGVSMMAAPIGEQPERLGLIYAFKFNPPPFSEVQSKSLLLLASLAGSEIKRRQFEETLRESEERFRFMAETTGDVLYRLHYGSMRYDYISPGILALTGYTPEELQSAGFSNLVHRIDMPGHDHISPEAVRQERLKRRVGEYRADYLISTKQGGLKWVRDHSFPWLDHHSQLVGSVGILSDVSEYKRAEARVQECTDDLIESEEKYRTLVENVPLVVYRMGSRQEILFVNGFFQEVFGYSTVEVFRNLGIFIDSVYPDDRKYICELRRRCYEEGKEFFAEYRIVHKNGQIVNVLDHAVPYRTYDGQIVSLDGIMVDMTGKMRFQEHLIQAQDIKTIKEVSARLAHEIRNPLVSAGGFARLLLTHMGPDDPNRLRAEIIVKEVGRLEAILRMLLTYIQPLELQRCDADIGAIVDSILHFLEPQIRSKNIHVELNLPRRTPPVSVDPVQMERALGAILGNAVSQTNLSSTVGIFILSKDSELLINIRYPAPRLSPDDVEHFFYPFTSNAACPDAPDLPMSKIIINKHGGHADVSISDDGQFSIQIKLPQ